MAAAQWLLNQDILLYDQKLARYGATHVYLRPAVKDAQFGGKQGAGPALDQEPLRINKEATELAHRQPLLNATLDESGLRAFSVLKSFYIIANPIAIEGFLREHRFLIGLLFSAFPKIKSIWGADVKAQLTLMDDVEDGLSFLMVLVRSDLQDVYAALNRFDEEWWLDHIRFASGLLNFSLHF